MTLREARIDLGAVRSNVAALRALVAPALTMAVVKANAYGHGAVGVAQRGGGCRGRLAGRRRPG